MACVAEGHVPRVSASAQYVTVAHFVFMAFRRDDPDASLHVISAAAVLLRILDDYDLLV